MKVSIIVRTYHTREKLLSRALSSIFTQDKPGIPVEAIVVVDGEEPISGIPSDERIKVIHRGKKIGRSAAANLGLETASGDFINFLDDDDWFHPNHVGLLATRLGANDGCAGAAYAAAYQLPTNLNVDAPEESVTGRKSVFFKEVHAGCEVLNFNPFPIQAVMFRRELLKHGARFDERLDALEDWLFWQALLVDAAVIPIQEVTSTFLVPLSAESARKRMAQHLEAYPNLLQVRDDISVSLSRVARSLALQGAQRQLPAGQVLDVLRDVIARRSRVLAELGPTRHYRQSMELGAYRAASVIYKVARRSASELQVMKTAWRGTKRARSRPTTAGPATAFLERGPCESFQRASDTVVFTSCNLAYLDKALTLAESVREHVPEVEFHILLADDAGSLGKANLNNVHRVFEASNLSICTAEWAFMHNAVEFCTAIKPFYFQHLLDSGYEKVLFLDPDMKIYTRPEKLLSSLSEADVFLTPHLYEPAKSRETIESFEISALAHGVFNLGLLGVKNTGNGRAVVEFWRDRTKDYCFSDVPRGMFTDQNWFNHVPLFFDGVKISNCRGINTAIWNMDGATLQQRGGQYFIDETPLEVFHFSGWDLGTPHQFAPKVLRGSAGRQLIADYQASVAKFQSLKSMSPWVLGLFDDGTPITQAMRTCYRRHSDLRAEFCNPYASGPGSYLQWLRDKGLAWVERTYDESHWVRRHF